MEKAEAVLPLLPPDTQKLTKTVEDCEWEAQKLQRQITTAPKRYEQTVNDIVQCQYLLRTTPIHRKM